MTLPSITDSARLIPGIKRFYIGAYGFEDRSLGWLHSQSKEGKILTGAFIYRYLRPKGNNRVKDLNKALADVGVSSIDEIRYDSHQPGKVEDDAKERFRAVFGSVEEIVVDVTAMTKLLILVTLCKLSGFNGTVRIVYSEAEKYSPTRKEFNSSKHDIEILAKFPSRGVESIVRTKCLGSIRMQGQPVVLVAFTSFNVQLVRHILGTISPHKLYFINGRPPYSAYSWREQATQDIHRPLIEEYVSDNPSDRSGLLRRFASTLDYRETIKRINEIYREVGTYERIICVATGSKMQTVGLFFSKIIHPDIHIEYPTPEDYFKELSIGIKKIHELVIPNFSQYVKSLATEYSKISVPNFLLASEDISAKEINFLSR